MVTSAAVWRKALFYEEQLDKEINSNREKHGKKPLKSDDDNDTSEENCKEKKCSTSNPESGWFHKG